METLTKRIWWAVAVIMLLLSAVVVWMIADARRGSAVSNLASRDTAVVWPSAVIDVQTSVLPPPVFGASSPAARAVSGRLGDPGAARTTIEICGGSPLMLEAVEAPEVQARALDSALQRVSPAPWVAMQRSADERIRAAGLVMAGDTGAVVKMATTTRDAKVYAMAQQACLPVTPGAARGDATANAWCAQLTARQRAVLEPDNAAAWLQVALEAQTQGDVNGTDEAMARAAQAPTLDQHPMALAHETVRYTVDVAPASTLPSPWVLRAAMPDAVVSPIAAAGRLCNASELLRGARRAQCATLANRLIDNPSSHDDLALGAIVYEQLGHDAATTQQRVRLSRAVYLNVGDKASAMAGPYACGPLAMLQQYARGAAKGQGWAWMRSQALVHAGSEATMLKRYDDATAPTVVDATTNRN